MEREENVLLGENIIERYDYEQTKNNLLDLIDYYFVYELEFHYISPPMITPSYEIRYDSNKEFTRDSKVEKYVISKITIEEDIIAFYNDLYTIYKRLNIDELKYFKQCYLKKKPEYIVMYEMNLNRRSFDKIKKSCVIKIALYFGIAIRKVN